jgi:ariadne-1
VNKLQVSPDSSMNSNSASGSADGKKTSASSSSSSSSDSKGKSNVDLDRYLFYYQRYHAHDQSKIFAKNQQEVTNTKMKQLQSKGDQTGWIEVQYLKDAMQQIMDCRQVLKNTYILGYFMKSNSGNRSLFEYQQQQLEASTEYLSELSEMSIDQLDKETIVNYTRITQTFMKNMLNGIDMTGHFEALS